MAVNNSSNMEGNNDYGTGNLISLLVGFILAASNGVIGWMGKISVAANWDGWIQALILGVIGSTATFFTNRFWRYLMDKKDKRKKES